MFEKIWSRHRILERPDGQTLLYIDCHLIHDGYAPRLRILDRARSQAACAIANFRDARSLRAHEYA